MSSAACTSSSALCQEDARPGQVRVLQPVQQPIRRRRRVSIRPTQGLFGLPVQIRQSAHAVNVHHRVPGPCAQRQVGSAVPSSARLRRSLPWQDAPTPGQSCCCVQLACAQRSVCPRPAQNGAWRCPTHSIDNAPRRESSAPSPTASPVVPASPVQAAPAPPALPVRDRRSRRR